MKIITAKVKDIRKVGADVFLISFNAPALVKKACPGQFLHLKLKTTVLRRPLSIHDVFGNTIRLLFKVRGRGTAELAAYRKGDILDILGPLGNGFSISQTSNLKPQTGILLAGGIGAAPLMFLARTLKQSAKHKTQDANKVIIGARNKSEILCVNEFKRLGYKVLIATDDGSLGIKGTGIDVLKSELTTCNLQLTTCVYCCGPEPMYKSLYEVVKNKENVNCQISFEQFMGCGAGACCGCVIETKHGYKKICKDGPVFDIKDIF